jgi:hypothetical protein
LTVERQPSFTILWQHDGARQLDVFVDADLPPYGPMEKRIRGIASIASANRSPDRRPAQERPRSPYPESGASAPLGRVRGADGSSAIALALVKTGPGVIGWRRT